MYLYRFHTICFIGKFDEAHEVNEGDDISVHSLPMMPMMPIARADSRESLHSITKQSKSHSSLCFLVLFRRSYMSVDCIEHKHVTIQFLPLFWYVQETQSLPHNFKCIQRRALNAYTSCRNMFLGFRVRPSVCKKSLHSLLKICKIGSNNKYISE